MNFSFVCDVQRLAGAACHLSTHLGLHILQGFNFTLQSLDVHVAATHGHLRVPFHGAVVPNEIKTESRRGKCVC